MIYLISQILLCLVLAALLGGALGWLAQRSRSTARLENLRHALAQQKRLLAEARGDVAMLADDFDDLRQRSQREIEELRAENRELPILADNLENSQLLVRQMIQRHEAQVREVTNENTALGERVVLLEAQADVRARALAELESARRDRASLPLDETDASGTDAGNRNAEGPGDEGSGAGGPDTGSLDARGSNAGNSGTEGPHGAESVDEILDEVMEVDDEFAAELREAVDPDDGTSARERIADSFDKEGTDGADRPVDGGRFGQPARADEANADDTHDIDADGGDAYDTAANDGALSGASEADDLTDAEGAEGYDEDRESEDHESEDHEDEANATLAIDVREMEAHLSLDPTESGEPPLFDPVERQDDLQQIFGIGPVTEKALNALGITSYPQLAELERHEIEKIADALQIGPERIERDDWVGNARRQLEEVLQEL